MITTQRAYVAPVLPPRRNDLSIAQGFGFVGAARARGDTRCISSSRAGATEPKNKRAAGHYASGAALVLACAGIGCGTGMSATHLAPPARLHESGLGIHIAEVHVSSDVRHEDLSGSSRVLVVLDLIADSDTTLELRGAQLSITGIDDPPDSNTRYALATGIGQPPAVLTDDEFIPPLELRAHAHTRAWVAFGKFGPRAHPELPEKVVLELPSGQQIALSQPGSGPIWHGKTQMTSFGTAIWVQGSADETSINWAISDNRYVAGPLVIGYRYGVGVRSPIYREGHSGDSLVCCNVSAAADVAWPVWRTAILTFAPFAGVEASFLANDADVTRRHWIGPSLGVELSAPMQIPRHGPFPIDYPRSLLGNVYLRLALVNWFGPDRSFPSFGYMLSSGTSFSY
jgi:hypothetical protein